LKARNWKFTRYPFDVEIALVLIISWIAIIVAGGTNAAMGVWKAYFFEPVLVFLLVLNVFRDNANDANYTRMTRIKIEKILWPLTISAFYISVVAIFQKISGLFIIPEFWPRVTGVFPYPNALGLYLGPLVLLMIGWFFYNFRTRDSYFEWKQGLLTVTIILSIASIIFARSEGALAAVAAGLIIFGILADKRVRLVTISLVIALGLAILITPQTREYAIDKITLRDLSGEIRKQQWRETWQMLRDGRLILGSGLMNYSQAIKPYHQEGIFFNRDKDPEFHRHVVWNEEYKKSHWQPVEIYLYPHNIVLNFWTELGILGVLLFIWIIFRYMIVGINIARRQTTDDRRQRFIVLGLMGAMIVIIIHGIVDVPYFKNDLAVIFWVLIGMLGLVRLQIHPSTSLRTGKSINKKNGN
jgi:O-antigen ligase